VTFRVGILGGGNISDTHARAASEVAGVEVAAVHGQNRERSERLAARHGATPYGELDAFLAHPGLDLVLVGSPSGRHAEHAMAAAERGLHVLVEKPLDVGTGRIDALLRSCERHGVKLGVFFQDRAAPQLAWLRRLIASGAMGELFLVTAQVKWYRPPEYYAESRWRGTWALDGGGALMNQGIHTVDLLLWLLGGVRQVFARTRAALHRIEVEDTVVACLEFAGGAIGTLEATTAAYPGFERRVELTGSEGTVVVQRDRVVSVQLRSGAAGPDAGEPADASRRADSAIVADTRGHRLLIEDFLAAVREGTEPLCGGAEGRRSVEVIEAIYRSARSGGPVLVGEP
jgi:UDP-N-acetyl-2-amino-2-deoxyglucuronate dehydrogenase